MDLIYRSNKEDIGVLFDYVLDLAYGSDENSFMCTVNLDNHVCRPGYMLYIENTEYGGIIDKIEVNTGEWTVSYSGRTWHGILEKRILEPDAGEDYLELSGEGNQLIKFLVERMCLAELFSVNTEDSGIEIAEYQMRYCMAYSGICKMLAAYDSKLNIIFKKGKAVISAVPRIDYSQDEEWDAAQMGFIAEKDCRPVNHLICLGTGDLKERHVIHLFADENGGVQPYATAKVPLSDADYILDTSGQVLRGLDEVAETYDYPNVAVTENYVRLTTKPADWAKNYGSYYQQDGNDRYKALESWEEDVYTQQKKQPYDWDTNYEDYFKKNGEDFISVESLSKAVYTVQGTKPADWKKNYRKYYRRAGSTYKEVEGLTTVTYRKQIKKPADWKKNYGSYFYYYSDGIVSEYRNVSGITRYRYLPQTQKPTDWTKNFKNYFIKNKDKAGYAVVEGSGEKKDKAPVWKAKRYYTRRSYQVAPVWEKKYYTEKITVSAPAWTAGTYYTKSIQEVPVWTAGAYYTKSRETFIPEFTSGAYFEKKIDNFAELVAGGLERLAQSYNCDSISISLSPEQSYDIGDIVGATEEATGISVWQPVSKKIVTIKENIEEIQYEIGV